VKDVVWGLFLSACLRNQVHTKCGFGKYGNQMDMTNGVDFPSKLDGPYLFEGSRQVDTNI
jgi:hypothetical protein